MNQPLFQHALGPITRPPAEAAAKGREEIIAFYSGWVKLPKKGKSKGDHFAAWRALPNSAASSNLAGAGGRVSTPLDG